MVKLLDRIIHGGPKFQERQKQKAIDRETYGTKEWKKDQLKKAEQEQEFKGELAGRRQRGYQRGLERGKQGGGLGGIMGGFSAGMKAFNEGGKALVGDYDVGNIGQGMGAFNMDGAFGMGGGRKRKQPSKRKQRRGRH